MAAPRDETKPMTEQEEVTQRLVNNLPFITAFFSLNVPAGLAVYWIINNILTTGITLLVRNNFKDNEMPFEVAEMMAVVDAPVIIKKAKSPNGSSDLRKLAMLEDKAAEGANDEDDDDDEDDDEDDEDEEKEDTSEADDEKKRKKRAASRNKGKKRT